VHVPHQGHGSGRQRARGRRMVQRRPSRRLLRPPAGRTGRPCALRRSGGAGRHCEICAEADGPGARCHVGPAPGRDDPGRSRLAGGARAGV
ncbi:MAG: hypothetical protein AVDCRST_MAG50-1048, partial [uncultured Acidimicrobiales bacterium]